MSHRPNPQSIGICALIALYSDPNSFLHELDNDEGPAMGIPENRVVAFLDESVSGIIGRHENQSSTETLPKRKSVDEIGEETSDAFVAWISLVKRRVGLPVVELLMDTLTAASESVDALTDLFESLKGAIHEGLVDATSIYGQYLRQYCLGFDELSFESAILLWQALRERVSIAQRTGWDERVDDAKSAIPVSGAHESPIVWSWPLSMEQMQTILRQDCIDFELNQERDNNDDSLSDTNNNGGSQTNISGATSRRIRAQPSFEQMEMYIRKTLKNDPELPTAHFLRYLNCLRHGERVGALDALHEYFDHSMVKRTATRSRAGDQFPEARNSKDILQFSAILLAMTHSSFGDSNLALLATEEAVRVAQQSKDAACVAFALGWLYEHHGQGTAERRELLRRCASRASQGQLRPLVAGAQLTLAKNSLRGENSVGCNNREAFTMSTAIDERTTNSHQEVSWKTSWNNLLQVVAEPSTDNSGGLDRPTFLSQNPKEVLESMALQRLVSAGIWDALGMPAMSKWASKVALNQIDELSYEDLLTAIQNISRCAMHGSPPTIRKNLGVGIHQSDAVQKKNEKDLQPSCSYARAVTAILQLRVELGLEGNNLEEPIIHSLALLFHEWAVNRGELDDAMALQTVLDSCLHPGLQNRDQLFADIQMQKYLYYCRAQNWARAKEIGLALAKYSKNKGLLKSQARILIQMAVAELEADRKQSTTALSPLLDALAMCEKWEMHGLHAVAMSILAQVFLRLQNPKRTIAIMNATIPTLIQREHIWFQAEAYLTLSKAHLKAHAHSTGRYSKTKNTSSMRGDKRCLQYALDGLNKCMVLFEECHDRGRLREVYYLQAQIHSLLCNTKKRDVMAEKFVKLGNARRRDTENTVETARMSILDALINPLAIQALAGRSLC